MQPSEHVTTEAKTDPERIVWALGCGLWAVVLLGSIGYTLHGLSAALLGGLLGLLLAYQVYRHGQPASVDRALGAGPSTSRGDTVDWRRLLDYEKFHFAGQLERDGHIERAETIYRHLVNHEFPSLVPYQRLAAIYRRRGAYRAEVDVLEQALTHVSAASRHPSTDVDSTRRELRQQCQQARERVEDASPQPQRDALK